MKYLECECCGFLAAITKSIEHVGLVCPTCFEVKCSEGKFNGISKEVFLKTIKKWEKQNE